MRPGDALRKVRRMQDRIRAQGDRRHHEIDEQFERAWEYAESFEDRIAQVEANTARIDALEAALAMHKAETNKAHK